LTSLLRSLKLLARMKTQAKRELTDREKADCLNGAMMSGIAMKSPHFGAGEAAAVELRGPELSRPNGLGQLTAANVGGCCRVDSRVRA